MALTDSVFLFDITVKGLESFIDCNRFYITCEFADLFKLNLKDPNDLKFVRPTKRIKKKRKNRAEMRYSNKIVSNDKSVEAIVQSDQSVMIARDVQSFMDYMKTYPIEISLCSEGNSLVKLGSTQFPWNESYIDYVNTLQNHPDLPPIETNESYSVFSEYNSKRIATIKLAMKLRFLNSNIINQFRSENEIPEVGTVRAFYHEKRSKHRSKIENQIPSEAEQIENIQKNQSVRMSSDSLESFEFKSKDNLVPLRSVINLANENQVCPYRSKSCSSIKNGKKHNAQNYIFNDPEGKFGDQVYCVSYFTVGSEPQTNPSSKTSLTEKATIQTDSSGPVQTYKLKTCTTDCSSKSGNLVIKRSCESICSLDLPINLKPSIVKCKNIKCNVGKMREVPTPPDERRMLDLTNINRKCCDSTQKVVEVVGGMQAQMKFGDDPCFCTCECRFGFTKKTTYCNICGGYEKSGEELARKRASEIPIPCPIYHKLVEKNKSKTHSGSDIKKKDSGLKNKEDTQLKKDDKFKFNYGYKAPHIGHSQCALPCSGSLNNSVPKHMGWLWTSDIVPGLKFRPYWRPGAANKHVVRLLKMARNPCQVIGKKKKKDVKKRPLKRPLIVVHKKDGEFTVTMETMKNYAKPRAINQPPFEDKPPLTYTIGRTEEENRERQKKKERAQRRLEREQRAFIESAFKNMCNEICLKTYQQALGLLPETEDPRCSCMPAEPDASRVDMGHSCSCSEDKSLTESETDSDEWIVEFTPPNALFDPTVKQKKIIKIDNSSQYTYLDYKVKLLDRNGNPVPRFFIGPDGKQQCSDLGGFWSPDHKWLEIKIDGYIAPDGRWAPHNFVGPDGDQVDAELGKFQTTDGRWLEVGVDGFVDCHGQWRFYSKSRGYPAKKKVTASPKKGSGGDKKDDRILSKPDSSLVCFRLTTPKVLSEMGIVGHGRDKKVLGSTLRNIMTRGVHIKISEPHGVQTSRIKKMSKKHQAGDIYNSKEYFSERHKCKHPSPSEKGILAVDAHGNKAYFKLKNYEDKRPKERREYLKGKGISLSSFHVPCFNSFINSEVMKQQLRQKIMALTKNVEIQV